MPQGFPRTEAFPPACLSPCGGSCVLPRARAARSAVGASGRNQLPTGGRASGGWMTAWAARGQAASGIFEKGWTEMGAQPSQECLLLSFQDPGSLEFFWPVLGLSPLAAAAFGSPPVPTAPPPGQGVPGVRGGGELEVGAGACPGVQRRLLAPVGLGGGHPRANRAC